MHIKSILVLLLVVCCVCISANRPDCHSIYRACHRCPTKTPKLVTVNDVCRNKTITRWFWRNLSHCDIQLISCQNPEHKLDCHQMAQLAQMKPRPLVRPRV